MESYKPALSSEETERLAAYAARHADLDDQFMRSFRDAQQEAYEGWVALNDTATELADIELRKPSRRVDTAVRRASVFRSHAASSLFRRLSYVASIVLLLSVSAFAIPSTREMILQRLFLPYFVNWNPPSSVTAGTTYSYRVQATEPAGIPLEYSLKDAPEGMTIDPSTGTIRWEPAEGQADQSHRVTVKVDAARGIERAFELVVAPAPIKPTPSSGGGNFGPFFINWNPRITATVNEPYDTEIGAFDPDGDTLKFTLEGMPEGMTFKTTKGPFKRGDGQTTVDTTIATLSWTPTSDQVGRVYNVTVRVDDPTHTIARTFPITVGQPNQGD